ncbi:hypothetical protein D3C75_1104860 [compost metagenome]
MANQLFEGLVGHHDLVGAATVDETNNLAVAFQHQEALWVLRDTRADFLQRGRLIPFIGANFDGVATLGIGGNGGAELKGAHGKYPWQW